MLIKKIIINFWEELPFYYLILGILAITNFILIELKTPVLMYGVIFPLFWVIMYVIVKKYNR